MTLRKESLNPEAESQILEAVKSIRYGSVEIIIHDSKIVQIERKEKVRFDQPNPAMSGSPASGNRVRRWPLSTR